MLDTLVFSWTYRQRIEWGMRALGLDAATPGWASAERCVAAWRNVIVGVAIDDAEATGTPWHSPFRRLVGRALDDGRELWRASIGEGSVAAASLRGALLVVDRGAQHAAFRARESALTARFMGDTIDVDCARA